MTNQATFKESDMKRPWYKRLTPVAWVLIGVLLLSCAGCSLVGGNWAIPQIFRGDEWATETPVPTEPTAAPTDGPSPTPTEWWEGDATATPKPTEVVDPFPAWWTDEMTQDADGQWWPPDEVIDDVKDAWYRDVEDIHTYLVETKPPDYDSYEEAATRNFAGPQLDLVLLGPALVILSMQG